MKQRVDLLSILEFLIALSLIVGGIVVMAR
jgi:hypothetical protein